MSFIKRKNNGEIGLEVDEIFQDAGAATSFNRDGLEGSLERPIKKAVFLYAAAGFGIILFLFALRAADLQIFKGDEFYRRSQDNYLRFAAIVPERGAIYDRDGQMLATNEFYGLLLAESEKESEGAWWVRRYPALGFLHTLGFLKRTDGQMLEGVSGLEAYYNDLLLGQAGRQIEEVDASGSVVGSGLSLESKLGGGILTFLSRDLQIRIAESINNTARQFGFAGGAGVMLDLSNGGVLALVSAPDFDPNILSEGASSEKISKLLRDPNKPFFNRAVSGLYPAGSTIKMAVAAGALNENIVSPKDEIFSSGSLIIPNPYDEARPTVFKDWKAHGWVDMERALAVSSNVYFYTIGGGFEEKKGLGAKKLIKYLSLFGFGETAGIDLLGEAAGALPDPDDTARGRSWNIGDTYNLSIGQGDLQVTPLQMAVYAAIIASKGRTVVPRLARAVLDENKEVVEYFNEKTKQEEILSEEIFNVIQNGMRRAVLEGTAIGLSSLPVSVAAKTGTAEIGKTGRVHSWSIGFFPYENPRVAFAILMENGSEHNLIGATYVANEVIRWMADNGLLDRLDNGFNM